MKVKNFVLLIMTVVVCLFVLYPSSYAQQDPSQNTSVKKIIIQEPEDIYKLSVDEITQSKAGQAFKNENYEVALEEFQKLNKQTPNDITILRYLGLSYDRLGQYEKAIESYNKALMLFPYHVPTHFYKGLTFLKMGETNKGINELTYVQSSDPEGIYGVKVKPILSQISGKGVAQVEKKPWNFYGRAGWMYDSNVIVASDDKTLRGANADTNAMRYELDGRFVYRIFERQTEQVSVEYGVSQSLHDDTLNEFNFHSQRAALQYSRIDTFFDKQWISRLRHDFNAGFLDDNLFSIANTTSLNTSVSLMQQTLASFYIRYGYTQFGPDGSISTLFSRDGHYAGTGMSLTFFNKKQTHWISLGYGWDGADTSGSNFDYSAQNISILVHTPLIEKTSVDFGVSYRHANYRNFDGSLFTDSRDRQDDLVVLNAVVSRSITDNIVIRAFYRYFNTRNTNDIFENRRHISGLEVNFSL